MILVSVLNCLYDSISQILRKNVEKRSLMENLDVVMLALDEICDTGYDISSSLSFFDLVLRFSILMQNHSRVRSDCHILQGSSP